ncbi:MAG: RHS repeat-associated core domain-containing protein, partial [Desulfovibrio sp.]
MRHAASFQDYGPDTGRFTAKDPIGAAGGDPDWYGYCLDDPVNGRDPEGLFKEGAGRRILEEGIIGAASGAATGALTGIPVLGVGAVPGATVGGIVGLSTGLLKGTIMEAL